MNGYYIVQMKFGKGFLTWIRLIDIDPHAIISGNSHNSDRIDVKCGVGQGCPLSPALFNLVIEMMAIMVRSSKKIIGLRLSQIEYK